MSAAYQSFAAASATLGAAIVVTKPSGTADGDLLIAVGCGSGAITAPAGWNTHAASLGAANPLWTKTASGEGANYSFTQAASQTGIVVIVRVNGQSGVDAASGATGTGAIVIPSLNSAGAGRLLMQIVNKRVVIASSWTGPGSQTERFDTAVGTPDGRVAGGDEIVGSGATGTRTWTPAAGALLGVGYMLAVAPGTQTVVPSGIDTTAAVGTPTVVPGQVTIVPTGIGSTSAVGAPTLLPGTVTITPSSIDPTSQVGEPTLVPGPVTVTVDGIGPTSGVGVPDVINATIVTPEGIGPTSAVGTPTVSTQPVVTGTVFNHETGVPVGAGVTVKLFDDNDLLVDSTTTDAGGGFLFYRPPGDTDLYWTLAEYEIAGVQYHGVSDRGCAAV